MYKNFMSDLRSKYQNYDVNMIKREIVNIASDLDTDNLVDVAKLRFLVQLLKDKID